MAPSSTLDPQDHGRHAELLAEVPLFERLEHAVREDLAGRLDLVHCEAGDTLFRHGDPGDALFLVHSGTVEIWIKNDTGERMLLETAGRGEFFGEVSLLDEGPRTATAQAIEPTELLRLDRDDLRDFLQAHPSSALDMLSIMGRRLRVTGEKLRRTATRNLNEEVHEKGTAVGRAADWIAAFSGSIPFLGLHVLWFGGWILWNNLPGVTAFDRYPYGLLTMCVSLEAIFLSVFVLLSQNRQAAKDRVRADIEYDVNLKAELEVAQLHVKLDEARADILQRLSRLERGLLSSTGPASDPLFPKGNSDGKSSQPGPQALR